VNAGDAEDIRLDAAKVAARLDVSPRHLARLVKSGRFPAPHYLGERKRWWLSEVQAWEASSTTATPPASVRRGAANLKHGGITTESPKRTLEAL
jgi:predicted DNA-binding transcriptional regulator AlpA